MWKRLFEQVPIMSILSALAVLALSVLAVVEEQYIYAALGLLFGIYSLIRTVIDMVRKKKLFEQFMQRVNLERDYSAGYIVNNLAVPCVICDENHGVLWYNNAFSKIEITKNIVGTKLESHFGVEAVSEEDGEFIFQYSDRFYHVSENELKSDKDGGIKMYCYCFFDITEFKDLQRLQERDRTVVGFITLDNYSEVMHGITDDQRSRVLSEVETKIANWASDSGGILQRYNTDRYLFVFNHEYLRKIIGEKFTILTEVRDVKNSKNVPFSVSLGISVKQDGETLFDCAKSARLALEVALGRGGDQAAIKTGERFEFYGGNTREFEKRTRVKARVIANSLKELILASSSVIIMGHANMDADCFGACIGIYKASSVLGKGAKIVMGKRTEAIAALYAKFKDDDAYRDVFITPEQAEDYLSRDTLLIVLDTHRPSLCENPNLIEYAQKIALIDHHRRSSEFIDKAALIYHEPYASSTCEMITEMLQYIEGVDLTVTEGEALYAGMVVDTKNFIFKTGVRTFEAASYLRRIGVSTIAVRDMFKTGMDVYIKKAACIEGSEIYKGNIAIASCAEKSPYIVAQIADELLTIKGIEASFVMSIGKSGISISGRSEGNINVQVILEELGGGGHMTVAGAQIPVKDIKEVKDRLIDAINKHYKAGGNEE